MLPPLCQLYAATPLGRVKAVAASARAPRTWRGCRLALRAAPRRSLRSLHVGVASRPCSLCLSSHVLFCSVLEFGPVPSSGMIVRSRPVPVRLRVFVIVPSTLDLLVVVLLHLASAPVRSRSLVSTLRSYSRKGYRPTGVNRYVS